MEDNWIHFSKVDFSDQSILQYHVDTRDFHVSCIHTECSKMPDLKKIEKHGNRFFFTADEVKETVTRYFNESGGDKEWRSLHLKNDAAGWFKYMRILRTRKGLIICDQFFHALNRDVIDSAVNTELL